MITQPGLNIINNHVPLFIDVQNRLSFPHEVFAATNDLQRIFSAEAERCDVLYKR